MDLTVTVEIHGTSVVAHVGGEVDAYTAPELRETLRGVVDEKHPDLVIDFRQVSFVDSTGLGVLVGVLKRQRAAGGTLRLSGLSNQLAKVIRLTGLDAVFEIYPDVEAALRASLDD